MERFHWMFFYASSALTNSNPRHSTTASNSVFIHKVHFHMGEVNLTLRECYENSFIVHINTNKMPRQLEITLY